MGTMVNTPLAQASDEEIRDFCEVMQLDVSKAKSRAGLLGVLGSAWDKDYIPTTAVQAIQADEELEAKAQQTDAVVPVATQRVSGGPGANDPIVVLKIQKTSLPGGRDPVPVSVNGVAKVIQRELVAQVPYRFYLALQDALREEVTQDFETGDLRTDEVTNYPMQVMAMPSAEEIAEFHRRTDGELMPA